MRRKLLWTCIAIAVLPGCAFQGLSFTTDERLQIVSPADREAVKLPVTIDWEISDFTVTGPNGDSVPAGPAPEAIDADSGYFAVFVDRAPQPPQQPLSWFAKDDESCRAADGCPDKRYLADRGVHTTRKTQFVIPTLPPPPEDEADRRELHEVTIVLLDVKGRRIGESAFTAEFEVVR